MQYMYWIQKTIIFYEITLFVMFSLQLRLLYESAPMAYIMEKAGGAASDGKQRILDIEPKNIHERCPVFMGSKDDVADVLKFYSECSK